MSSLIYVDSTNNSFIIGIASIFDVSTVVSSGGYTRSELATVITNSIQSALLMTHVK